NPDAFTNFSREDRDQAWRKQIELLLAANAPKIGPRATQRHDIVINNELGKTEEVINKRRIVEEYFQPFRCNIFFQQACGHEQYYGEKIWNPNTRRSVEIEPWQLGWLRLKQNAPD